VFARFRRAGLRGSHSASGPEGSTLVQPLGLAGSPRGYLLVTGPHPWDAAHHGAVATAVALLSLDAERRADAQAAAREIRAGAWALFLAGAADSAVALLGLRAAATGPVSHEGRFPVQRVRGADALGAAESRPPERRSPVRYWVRWPTRDTTTCTPHSSSSTPATASSRWWRRPSGRTATPSAADYAGSKNSRAIRSTTPAPVPSSGSSGRS